MAMIIDPRDNVAVALREIKANQQVRIGDKEITVQQFIPFGHKVAIREIRKDEPIVKYGEIIGMATQNIKKGEYVHVHNIASPKNSFGEG
jgi:altronate dehydratase